MYCELKNILVTGAGGIGGFNFVKALRLSEKYTHEKLNIIGTDYNPYHLHFPYLDKKIQTPKHSDNTFRPLITDIVKRFDIQFIHPHPSVEAKIISQNRKQFIDLGVNLLLPEAQCIGAPKLEMLHKMQLGGISIPKTQTINSLSDITEAFKKIDSPLWIRANTGAGAYLGLKVSTENQAKLWIELNHLQHRALRTDFIIHEYLNGRDVAFDSLWHNGELITSYSRERLEYPFKHISLSGLTGTPSVSRIVYDKEANNIGIAAVKAFDSKPNGFFSVDMKADSNDKLKVTEVDGKWHTTSPLWGYAFNLINRCLGYNLAYIYLKLGSNENITLDIPKTNLFLDDYYLLRQMDCGVLLLKNNKVKLKLT